MVIIDNSKTEKLPDFAKDTILSKYAMEGEGIQDFFARIAKAYSEDEEHAQRIYNYMSDLWFMPSTPVLMNGGAARGLPISCFLNEIEDSIGGISNKWNENIYMAVNGGGIGTLYSNVRSIGEKVEGNGGKTSGIIPFIKVQDSLTVAISQGGFRRGSSAVYLDIDHPEIEEFIDIRRPTGGDPNRKCLNIHHGVNVSDDFMHAVENGLSWNLISPKSKKIIKTVDARDLWIKLITARLETGEPYILFKDTVNKKRTETQKKLNLNVNTSNLCVAPETLVMTLEYGYRPISEMENEEVHVWNGEEWSKTTIRKTSEKSELIKVSFNDGSFLECTKEHKFYVKETYTSCAKPKLAKDLKKDHKLEKYKLPSTMGERSTFDSAAYSKGFYSGDGNRGYDWSWVYEPKNKSIPHLIGSISDEFDKYNRKRWVHGQLDKDYVPNGLNIDEAISWLEGYFDADACIIESTNCQNIQITSINLNQLHAVKLLLQIIGVHSTITLRRKKGDYLLPKNDGSGENGYYNCKTVHLLNVNGTGVQKLKNLGFSPKRLILSDQTPQRDAARFIKVLSVEHTGREDKTYCFTEPKRNRGMFNGIVTGNCNEITLPTGKDYLDNTRSAVCCLASLNIETFNEWEKHPQFIQDVMLFLDNVLQSFIDNAPDQMKDARYAAMMERSVGLGVMGLHYYFQKGNIPFDSITATFHNKHIFKTIKEKVDSANTALSEIKGACPDSILAGTNVRFSNCTAIAPTATISIVCGATSPSIEPIFSNCFNHKNLQGSTNVKNRYLEKVLETHGMNKDEIWDSIKRNNGSVQHLDFLNKDEKETFKTALEINQGAIIKLAADRQPFIDQGQSVNIFLPADIHKKDLHAIHMEAWRQGLKGLYYCRSTSVLKAEDFNFSVNTCESCQ